MTKSIPVITGTDCADGIFRMMLSTTRTSWAANNAKPDSIITNMIRRNLSLLPPVEPKLRSTEVLAALTSKNTLRILNTIKPVTRAFTAMDTTKLVRTNVFSQITPKNWSCTNVVAPSAASQVARRDKLKLWTSLSNEDRLTDLWMWWPGMKEWLRYGYFDPTRSNNGRSLKIYVNKTDDSYNTRLCVLRYIGRGSHNNLLLWIGQLKDDITLTESVVYYWYQPVQPMNIIFLQIELLLTWSMKFTKSLIKVTVDRT